MAPRNPPLPADWIELLRSRIVIVDLQHPAGMGSMRLLFLFDFYFDEDISG